MTPPPESELPALLKVPELTATLEALGEAIKEQDDCLKAARTSLSEKMVENETLKNNQATAASQPAASPEATIDEFREPFARAMAEVSVMLWRIRQCTDKLDSEGKLAKTGESKELRRIQRDLATCDQALKTLGVETVDRANADLNTGIYRDMEVVSNEMTSEVSQVTVAEVLKPAVHFRVLHPLLRKAKERADQPPFIIQKCQVITKSPPLPGA
jgi:hypothetical protein